MATLRRRRVEETTSMNDSEENTQASLGLEEAAAEDVTKNDASAEKVVVRNPFTGIIALI